MNNVTETIPESMQNSVLDEIQAVITEKYDELEWNIQFKQSETFAKHPFFSNFCVRLRF